MQVLNDEAFAILVLMALFTTFITVPTVMAIYTPARVFSTRARHRLQSTDELRILACIHGHGNIPSLINLIESTRSTNKASRLKLYVMHLIELTERSSSIILVQRLRKNGLPFINRLRRGELHDRVADAFQANGQLGRVTVRPTTSISMLTTMHEDICHVAEKKMVAMIVLPFHKQWRKINDEDEEESVGHEWRGVNQRVLEVAPCSVAMLVDRGLGSRVEMTSAPTTIQNICVIFFGGPDDREALELGGRMAEHPTMKVTVIRFLDKNGGERDGVMLTPSHSRNEEIRHSFSTAINNPQAEKEHDEGALAMFIMKWEGTVELIEKIDVNIIDEVLGIGRRGDYDLIIVGRAQCQYTVVAALVHHPTEHPELGPIGDVLASSGQGITSSVLVVQAQQHDTTKAEELLVS
ncbi:hypothetical protein RD792_011807 [Penstemon davidsonii]|uniref:Uncharacterized protein n=1 Tax=Penstemon davidsonii TaxID=160366 RepID=A0ABR0CVK2_9LAMI|nr:hypothetical protein RD792_011807 [Penstemon davidsonii]